MLTKLSQYFKIKAAAEFIGVTPNTLRNWEKEGKLVPYRAPFNKYRLYKREDLENLLKEIK